MFYSYDLSFDRASALSYGVALATTNTETSVAGTRKNGAPLGLSAIETQVICGVTSPFTSDFTGDFYGGPGYLLFTVNKFLKSVDAQVSFLFEPPTHFHLSSQTAPTTSSQVAHASLRHFAAQILTVLSNEAIRLVIARPFHAIVAAQNPNMARVRVLFSKTIMLTFPQVVILRASHGSLFRTTSAQVARLLRTPQPLLAALSGAAYNVIRTVGKSQVSAQTVQTLAAAMASGKLLAFAIAEVVSVVRRLPWRINVSAGATARVSFGGGNLFLRAFSVLSTGAVGLRSGQAGLRSAQNPNAGGTVRTPNKVLASVDAGLARVLKQPGSQRNAVSGQVVASRRQPGLVRGITLAAMQGMQKAAAHFASVYAAVSPEAVASATQRAVARVLGLPRSQTSSVSLSALRTLLRSIAVASSQINRLVRSASTSASATTAAAQRLVHPTTKLLSIVSTHAEALIFPALFLRFLGATWTQSWSAIRGVSKARSVASAESTASVLRRGAGLGVIASQQVAALRRLTAKFLRVFTPQTAAIGRGDTKWLRATSSSAVAAYHPSGIVARTGQGQATSSVTYYHFFVATWAAQQTSLLPPGGGPAEPPSFGPIDPADQTIFGFDWASRAYPNDTITSAMVTCVPPGLPIVPGSLFVSGSLIEVTIAPMVEPVLPTVFSLRCTATFASGRVSSFSIPVPVRNL